MWEEEEEGERGVRRRQRKAEEDRERGVEDRGKCVQQLGSFRWKHGRSVPHQSPHLEVFHLFVELFLAWCDAKC